MSEYMLPGRITTESEFLAGSGACGPTALSGALRWAVQQDSPDAATVMHQLQQWGLCDSIGVTNTPQLRQAAQHAGYAFPIQSPTAGEDLLGFATHFFEPTPRAAVVLEIANGQALNDSITGQGEDASNLHYHFICLVGYNTGGPSPHAGGKVLPAGFWAIDGDSNVQNPIVNGGRVHRGLNSDLQYFTVADLAAAQPYDAFALFPRPGQGPGVEPTMTINLTDSGVAPWFVAGPTNPNGQSWKCKANGNVINAGGILDFYRGFGNSALCGITFLGLPISGEIPALNTAGVVLQVFERAVVVFDPKHAVDGPPGAGAVYLAHLDNGQAQALIAGPLLADLNRQLAAAQQQLGDALAQVHELQAKLDAETGALTAAQQQDASIEQQLTDANNKVQQLDALVAQLQTQIDQLKQAAPESDVDKQAIAALLNLDAAIIAAKKASGL